MKALRVLYVDDELDLLGLAETFFKEEGIQIDTCSDYQSALRLAQRNEYDVIISDAKMPSGGGVALIRQLKRENLFRGRSILVTGHLDAAGDSEAVDEVVFKPISFDDLVDLVKAQSLN